MRRSSISLYIYKYQCPGLQEVRGQPRFETKSLYHFMFKGEGGVVHGKMASAHFMCVTLSGNPFANKQLICFSFKKYKSTIYCYIYYFTLMSFIYLVYHTVKNLYIISMSKGSLVSEFCSLGETDILSCRFVANYMIFIQLTLVS